MAPTKNVSVSDAPQKVVKKRVPKTKLTKPPLKSHKRNTETIVKPGKPPKITRKVSKQQKIELANEVALEQLSKPLETQKPLQSLLPKVILPKTDTLPECSKKKPGRKRKNSPPLAPQDSNSDASLIKTEAKPKQCEESACKPKRKRKHSQGKVSESENIEVEQSLWSVHIDTETPLKTRFKKNSTGKATSDESEHDLLLTKQVAKTTRKTKKKGEQKVIPDYFLDKPNNGETVVPKEVPKTPVKRVRKQTPKKPKVETTGPTAKDSEEIPTKKRRGRQPKAKTDPLKQLTEKSKPKATEEKKGKGLTAKEIKTAALVLENNLKKITELVHTRPESVASSASNLSWTKDISTESNPPSSNNISSTNTFVAVKSSDFFRFNKKLPFVQVENTALDSIIEKVPENVMETSFDSSTSTSDSKISKPSSSVTYDVSVGNPALNLSTSSLTDGSRRPGDSTELMRLEYENIIRLLNQFNAAINKWGLVEGDDDDDDDEDILSRISKATKEMSSSGSILDDENISINKEANRSIKTRREAIRERNDIRSSRESVKGGSLSQMARENAAPPISDADDSDPDVGLSTTSSNKSFQREKFPVHAPDNFSIPTALHQTPPGRSASSKTFTSDNWNYVSFENNHCDDEDALSLFAESLSGMESQSRRSSIASVHPHTLPMATPVPYVPEPRQPLLQERYSYRPTRISNSPQEKSIPVKTIQPDMVKIQNADSSSICKDTSVNGNAESLIQLANQLAQSESFATAVKATNQPIRVFPRYQPMKAVRSTVYKNICFFNLASQCKNVHCRFPHKDIDISTLKCRLSLLSEDNLIEEYLLTCNFVLLRRKYGLLFMQECKRRAATRLLMEMNVDLGLGVVIRDPTLNNEALDITLLHLNTVSFDACDDWLKFKHNGSLMCDALIARVADSQNLAQFKGAFVKLANFMAQIKRPVNADKVKTIVERVCLLPCDENLVEGAVCLMINTDPRLFDDPITHSFEVQLSNVSCDVAVPYWLAKKKAIECRLQEVNRLSQGATHSEPVCSSPDTTYLDYLNKAKMAQPTTFKRTINTDTLFKSPKNPAPKPFYANNKAWRGRGHRIAYKMRGGSRLHSLDERTVHRTPTNY